MERKSARQKRATKQRAHAGTPSRSTVPFGYRQEDNGLAVEPAEAMMVRDAYSAILAGASLHMIAKEWNAGDVPTRRGNTWSGATVRQLLMSWRNAGLAVYQGEPVGEGDWPPIVDRDVLDGVRAILTDRAAHRRHLQRPQAPADRDRGVRQVRQDDGIGSPSTGQRRVYVCKHCFGVTRDMARVDELIGAIVVGRLSRPDAADLLITERRDDISELRDRAAALRARQDEAAALFADGAITAHS